MDEMDRAMCSRRLKRQGYTPEQIERKLAYMSRPKEYGYGLMTYADVLDELCDCYADGNDTALTVAMAVVEMCNGFIDQTFGPPDWMKIRPGEEENVFRWALRRAVTRRRPATTKPKTTKKPAPKGRIIAPGQSGMDWFYQWVGQK